MALLEAWEYGSTARRPVNTDFFDNTDSFWKKDLPVLDVNRVLHPMSTTWRRNLCTQMDIDPDTSQAQAQPSMLPGYNQGRAWMRTHGDPLYIVDSDVPLREIRNANSDQWSGFADYHGAYDQWATRMQTIIDEIGGLPIPLDAVPSIVSDKYIHVYDPSRDLFAQLYWGVASDHATLTFTMTGGVATSGSFVLTFRYRDNRTYHAYTFVTAPISYNVSAANMRSALMAATTTIPAVGTLSLSQLTDDGFLPVTGGPLNVAPITATAWNVTPMYQIAATPGSVTFNNGAMVGVVSHTAGPIDMCYGGSVIAPGGGRDGVSAHWGAYRDFFSAAEWWEDRRWGGAATSIEYQGGQPSYDEVAYAQANDIGLDHALTLVVGNAQNSSSNPGWVLPAGRTDGTVFDNNWIPEGSRVTFPADVDLSYVEANFPEFMWAALTIRDKGAIVYDRTTFGCELTLRQPSFVTDDTVYPSVESGDSWADLLPVFNTQNDAPWRYMVSLPWHKAEIYAPAFSTAPALPDPLPPPLADDPWRVGTIPWLAA